MPKWKPISRRKLLRQSVQAGTLITLGSLLPLLSGCDKKESTTQRVENLTSQADATEESLVFKVADGLNFEQYSIKDTLMDDGAKVPPLHDGMGAFAAKDGGTILVRNHEASMRPSQFYSKAYDPTCEGGTTTLVLDKNNQLTRHYMSLTGTFRNCAGGITPWNTWISCEETVVMPEGTAGATANTHPHVGKRHGYAFEVDPFKTDLQRQEPLRYLGRFNHEAAAVDAASGIVYMTQDEGQGCFWRFVPSEIGNLRKPGQLQAMKIKGQNQFNTGSPEIDEGATFECEWVDIEDYDPANNTVHLQAQEKGAAIVVRGEGCTADADGIYFAPTSGGGRGQVFHYTPDDNDLTGTLKLIYKAGKNNPLASPDNIFKASWGDLLICEDSGMKYKHLYGLTPQGVLYEIASSEISEWAGACVSPTTGAIFVNLQNPGITIGITGDLTTLRKA